MTFSPRIEAQHYLLNCLTEELTEMAQEASKMYRFSPLNECPIAKKTNLDKFLLEQADFNAIKFMLAAVGVPIQYSAELPERFTDKVARTLHYARVSVKLGTMSHEAFRFLAKEVDRASAALSA